MCTPAGIVFFHCACVCRIVVYQSVCAGTGIVFTVCVYVFMCMYDCFNHDVCLPVGLCFTMECALCVPVRIVFYHAVYMVCACRIVFYHGVCMCACRIVFYHCVCVCVCVCV